MMLVHERMVERGLADRFVILESFKTHDPTKLDLLRLIRRLATADVVLIDDKLRLLGSIRPSAKTKMIHVGRAGSGLLDPAGMKHIVSDFQRAHPEFAGRKLVLFTSPLAEHPEFDFRKLHHACGESTVVLFSAHHADGSPVAVPPDVADRIVDVSSYSHPDDLLQVADVLITDYSPIIFEFALLDRPMIFFAPDADIHATVTGENGDYEQVAPGKVCESMDEMVEVLAAEDYQTWKIDAFRRENLDEIDSHAVDRVIDSFILSAS